MTDQPDALFVMAASDDSVDDAVGDYEAIKALYGKVRTWDEWKDVRGRRAGATS